MNRSVRGSYVLELSLVSLGAVFLSLAVWDVTAVVHARNSLRAALEHGLRCATPADAACSVPGLQTGSASSSKRYNVWVSDGALDGEYYASPMESATAAIRWYQHTELEILAHNRKLLLGSSAVPDKQWRLAPKQYEVAAESIYMVRDRSLPYVIGDPLDQRFVVSENDHRPVPALITQELKQVGKIQNGQKSLELENIELIIKPEELFDHQDLLQDREGVWPQLSLGSIPCFTDIKKVSLSSCPVLEFLGDTPADKNKRDFRRVGAALKTSNVTQFVQVMFQLQGEVVSSLTDENADGALKMTLYVPNTAGESHSVDLGGRLLNKTSSGSFTVRGASPLMVEGVEKSAFAYKEEINTYDHLLVPVGQPFSIKLTLLSKEGKNLAWTAKKIRLFAPHYSVTKDSNVTCSNTVRYNDKAVSCAPTKQVLNLVHSRRTQNFTMGNDTLAYQCGDARPVSSDPDQFEWVEDTKNPNLKCSGNEIKWDCAPGTKIPWFDRCDQPSHSNEELLSMCPAPEKVLTAFHKDPKLPVTWNWGDIEAEATPVSLVISKCNDNENLKVCADIQSSKEVTTATSSCAADMKGPIVFPTTGLMDALRDTPDCSLRSAKAAAEKGLLANPEIPKIAWINLSTQIIPSDTTRIWPIQPTDQCLAISKEHGSGKNISNGAGPLLCGLGVSEVEVEKCCKLSKGKCRVEQITKGYDSQNGSGGGVNLDAATAIAQYSLNELVRGVSAGSSDSAAKVNFALGSSGSAQDQVVATASLGVPTLLLGHLSGAGDRIELTETRSRRLEQGLVASHN